MRPQLSFKNTYEVALECKIEFLVKGVEADNEEQAKTFAENRVHNRAFEYDLTDATHFYVDNACIESAKDNTND